MKRQPASTLTTMDTRPVEILFSNLPQSDAIKAAITRFASRLDGFPCDIRRFRICLASDNPERSARGPFLVHIEVDIPGRALTADEASDVDVHVALLNAFREMRARVRQAISAQRASQPSCDGAPASSGVPRAARPATSTFRR
uniref:Uncharacterized protein n=3 Tax=Ralstonia TaxID=48736 RepID=C6BL75_RALP1